MTRVIIICEGETEQEFCRKVLGIHFAALGIFIQPPRIKKSMGGLVKWVKLREEILLHLKTDTTAYVSTLIDYYGIRSKDEFPKWDEATKHLDNSRRMEILEQGMAEDIDESLRIGTFHIFSCMNLKASFSATKQFFTNKSRPKICLEKRNLRKYFDNMKIPRR